MILFFQCCLLFSFVQHLQLAQRPRHTWESLSESVCCAAMHCMLLPVLLNQAIGNVSACLSYSCVFRPRHVGPAFAVSGCLKMGLETVFAVCLPYYLVCLLGKTAYQCAVTSKVFHCASKGCMAPADSCIQTSSTEGSLSSQVCL